MATNKPNKENKKPIGLDTDRKLTESQAQFLAREASVSVSDLADLTVGQVNERLIGLIDPFWLFNRKICGRVVQRDPLTGELRGVPGATVEVQDTDCGGIFRRVGQFGWFYPINCTRDTIATAVTDACGNFCVWVPRWLSEWVLSWRKARICVPVWRPWLVDVFDPEDLVIPDFPPDPGFIDPLPEPFDRFSPLIDATTVTRLADVIDGLHAGSARPNLDRVLNAPLQLPRPAPNDELRRIIDRIPKPVRPDVFAPFGPYSICRDVYVPEWQHVIDVPDITFKVTQQINGTDTVVYSEGYFEVRWDDTASGDVVLEANEHAVATTDCHDDNIVCVNTAAIISASEMPLDQTAAPLFHDDATGFGVRTNRPSANGVDGPSLLFPSADGEAPIADTLVLRGCVHVKGAQHYRVMIDRGVGPVPITGVSWSAVSASLGVITIAPDSNGWIEIKDLIGGYQHLLMRWPTVTTPNVSHDVFLEIGDAGKNVIQTSPGHTFVIDNSQPSFSEFSVTYRVGPFGPFLPLDLTSCPKIFRSGGADVHLRVTWRAGATHLRNAYVAMGGCGGGQPTLDSAASTARWYWQNSGDSDSGSHTAEFTVPGAADAGCYSVTREAASRAYNPGSATFNPSSDYYEDDRRRWEHRSWSISIVDS